MRHCLAAKPPRLGVKRMMRTVSDPDDGHHLLAERASLREMIL